ncbi:MAG: type II secretion system F family protein [Anaerolineaceae bacterium]|nr:type II secretion system F family protein [Anaerolineaceae bacterium]
MDTTLILIIGGALAVIILVVGIVVSVTSERAEVEDRLGRYAEAPKAEAERGSQTPVADWLNKRVAGSSFGEKLARDLARADVKLKTGEFVTVMLLAAILVGFIVWFIAGQNILGGLAGAAIGLFLPRFYVNSQQSKRLVRFNDQLGDMLNLMVNGLRAGYSTMQAMEAVSKELPAPICDEFRRVVQEMQLGVPMQTALDNLLRRIPSEDLDLVITAINVQREVGGNLAEILDTISFTIRERVRIKGEIRVLTSQTMYSGRMLAMLPLGVIGILYLLNREYMMEFFNPANNARLPCGYIALACVAILIVVGYVAMNKLADIEV